MIKGIFTFILIGIGGVMGIWLIVYIIRKFFKVILAILLAFLVFIGIGFFFAASKQYTDIEADRNNRTNQNETSESYSDANDINEETTENTGRKQTFLKNSMKWSAYDNENYSFNYSIRQSDYEAAKNNRSNYIGNTWGEIYDNLYLNDKQMLSGIYRKFDSLRPGYNALDFARLIVSSVQEVPYTWILIESCEDAPNSTEIHSSGYECLGNIRNYAVLSPTEFMVTHKGDCDTKSLVLYTILKKFNYDVHILISEQYAHAMLGINIPAAGSYISSTGTKYYVWETTVKGMDVGIMAPQYNNLSFWNVAL